MKLNMDDKRKIVLVIADNTGKNILFVLDNLSALTLKEAIKAVEKGEIAGVHLVKGSGGLYLRADPNLGAILIDEYVRLDIKDKFDWLAELDTSVGVAQVKIETARRLIKNDCYNPNPKDKHLSKENIDKVSRKYLYHYVQDTKHSIYFAAAEIKRIIDEWAPYVDLSRRPEIIGTIYSLDKKKLRKPHPKPGSNDRGEQIGSEFYRMAKKILKP